MTLVLLENAVVVALILSLMFVIYDDMQNYRIKNEIVFALLILVLIGLLIEQDSRGILFHAAFGLGSFFVLLFVWARGWVGGGDAKLLTVALLWHGERSISAFSVLLLGFTLAYWLGAKLHKLPFRRTGNGHTIVPYGPAIGSAWIASIIGSEFLRLGLSAT